MYLFKYYIKYLCLFIFKLHEFLIFLFISLYTYIIFISYLRFTAIFHRAHRAYE